MGLEIPFHHELAFCTSWSCSSVSLHILAVYYLLWSLIHHNTVISLSFNPSLPIFILFTNSYLSLKYIHHQHSYLQSCYCNTKVERMRDTKLPEVVFLLLFTLILASKFTQGHRHVTLFYMNSSFHMSSIQFSPYFHLVSSTLSPFMILDLLLILKNPTFTSMSLWSFFN